MSVIQKVLDTDTFKDLVNKVNAVIDYCENTLRQSLENSFKISKIISSIYENSIYA